MHKWIHKQRVEGPIQNMKPRDDNNDDDGDDDKIYGSVHRDSILISSNKMQQYAGTHLLQNHYLHVSVSTAPVIRRT